MDGAVYDWAERYAEPARRRAVDTLAPIAEILRPSDPEQSLTALESALIHDPCNEAIYHTIMHIQHSVGRFDAARRTLHVLRARLAEFGLTPAVPPEPAAPKKPGAHETRDAPWRARARARGRDLGHYGDAGR